MATLLYRLGRFCYRRRWWVASCWLVVVLAVGGSALAFSGSTTNNFSIPGSPSQQVLDDLKTKLPEAAGGSGTVVFETRNDTAFTAAQRSAIEDVVKNLGAMDGVERAVDPFQVRQQVSDGQRKIADGKAKLDAAGQQLDAGRAQLQAAGDKLPPAQRAQQQAQLDKAAAAIKANKAELSLKERLLEASSGMKFVSGDDSAAYTQIQFSQPIQAVSAADRQQVQDIANKATSAGVKVFYSKDIVEDVSGIVGGTEIIGVAVAAIVLIVMLGTLLAAGLPLLMAVVGVAVGVGTTFALTSVIDMTSVSPILALMLGLAVGIDYSLFIVNRHRTQLLAGMDLDESVGRATGTSGNAVLFAGLTVIIALAALAIPGIPFLTVMGLAGAGTVAAAVLVALTLTPAALGLLGTRVISRRRWAKNAAATSRRAPAGRHAARKRGSSDAGGRNAGASGRGWGGIVTRHPVVMLAASVLLLGAVALPAASLRLGLPDGGSEPVGSTAYQAYTTLGDKFGAGINGPLVAVGQLPAGLDDAAATVKELDVVDALTSIDNVEAVVPAGRSTDDTTAIFQIIPAGGPADLSTETLVHDIRGQASAIAAATGVDLGITGQTAVNIDVSHKLSDALPLYLGIVVGLSLVLLLLVFRSLLVPVLATGGFLLSLGAAFGAVVAIYQWGWLSQIFSVDHPAPVLSFLPIIMIGVLFGLAMDYQMFLVSGMRESYVHGENAKAAVRSGFSHGAAVVTAAAIIMVSVFGGFIFSELSMIRPIGFGLAFGVLVDAFIIRMTFTPAAMYLLGRSAWYLPKWLDRVLPDVDVEGAALAASLDRNPAAAPADASPAEKVPAG